MSNSAYKYTLLSFVLKEILRILVHLNVGLLQKKSQSINLLICRVMSQYVVF